MKTMYVVGILIAAAVFVAEGATEPEIRNTCGDRGLLLTISVPEGSHKAQARIPLTLNISNSGPDQVHIPSGFTYASESDAGKETVLVGSGTFILCQSQGGEYLHFRGGYVKVSGPGQTVQAGKGIKAYTVDLAKCFDLKSGEYDVQLLFTKRYSGFIDAASNRITVTVE